MSIISLILFAAAHLHGQSDSLKSKIDSGPEIQFETLFIDLGDITFDSLQKTPVVFKFTNTGNEDLKVSVGRSGGFFDWVVPFYSTEPIAPGQIGTISLKNWLPRYGPFNKSFLVHTNASESEIRCRVKGNILLKNVSKTTSGR